MSRISRVIGWMSVAADLILLVVAFFVAFAARGYLHQFPKLLSWQDQFILVPFALLAWVALGYYDGMYFGRERTIRRELRGLLQTSALTALVMASLAFLLKQDQQSRPLVVLFAISAFLLTALLRVFVQV